MKRSADKSLIIQILIADMKHEQLLEGLQKLGFSSELHGSGLSSVVAELVGLEKKSIPEEWFDTYMQFLQQATHLPVTGNGENLRPLAEAGYGVLSTFARVKNDRHQ